MSFPKYPKYKDSGVEWLGEIPEHWAVLPVHRLIRPGRRITYGIVQPGERDETGRFMVRGQDYSFGWASPETVFRVSDAVETPYKRARLMAGDMVMTIVGAGVGNVATVPPWLDGANITQTTARLSVDPERANPEFVTAVMQSSVGKRSIELYAKGAAQPGLNLEHVRTFPVTVPTREEQTRIVAFLHTETAKIDSLVAEQRRLIELLREKRQAVISHAVTKGLNPNVPLRASGIEWLGDVPEHWRMERGRFLYKERVSQPEQEDGVVTAFRDGQVTLRTNRRTEGFTLATLEVGYQRVMAGDLVIHGMDAFAGAVGVSESTGKCTPEYSILVPMCEGIENGYFARLIRLMALRNFIYVICPSVRERAPRFRFTSFKDVWLPVPPFEEQRAIVQRIESATNEFDALTSEAERAIELLQERRTALISAAVTGKIDVREFACQEPI